VGATTTFPNPNAAGTTYLWQGEVRDKNYLLDSPRTGPFSGAPQVRRRPSSGRRPTARWTSPRQQPRQPLNIDAFDSFKKKSLNVKALFAATKSVDVTVGAAYEKYDFSDVQMDGYLYASAPAPTQNYLTALTLLQLQGEHRLRHARPSRS
jgi:hypothetical protein